MRCRYCFYDDECAIREVANYGIMSEAVMDCLIFKALTAQSVTFAFQGGEPTLAGIDFFTRFVEKVNEIKQDQKITYTIQTNGCYRDEKWADFFKQNDFLVGVSLDGYQENHNYYRRDKQGKNTFSQIMKNIRRLEEKQVPYNILTVLTSRLAREPEKLYRFYQKHNFQYIQLILCLDGFDRHNPAALTPPGLYEHFFSDFFTLWANDPNIRHISLFDNLYLLVHRQRPYQCGIPGQCAPQLVVEADGSVYPCDFYVLDEYRCGYIQKDGIPELFTNMKPFLNEQKPLKDICRHCRYVRICQGGCKRQNSCFCADHYCGYQALLDKILSYFI